MQSKTSFSKLFKGSLFVHNLKSRWPMWGGYLFMLTWFIPGVLFFERSYGNSYDIANSFQEFIVCDTPLISLCFAVIMGLVAGVGIFGYLQRERSCSFFHSLPMTRTGLFFTNFLSGYAIMFLPNILVFILTGIIEASYGAFDFKDLIILFLIFAVEELFFYSFAVMFMIMSGNSIAAVILYGIFNCYVLAMLFVVNNIGSHMFWGISGSTINSPSGILGIISPVEFFSGIDNTEAVYQYGFGNNLSIVYDYSFSNCTMILIVGFVSALILIAISYIMYRIRKSENSGDIIAIRILRPIFRWGAGASFGLVFTWFFITTLFGYPDPETCKIFVISFFIFFGSVGFWGAEMILKKSFRVFSVKYKEWLVFLGVSIILYFGFLFYGKAQERFVPDADKVETVQLTLIYNTTRFTDEEDIERVTELQKVIVSDYYGFLKNYESLFGMYDDTLLFYFTYVMDDGKVYRRSYNVPQSIIDNSIMKSFCDDFIEDFVFEGHSSSDVFNGEFYLNEDMIVDYYESDKDNVVYEAASTWYSFDSVEGKKLFEALQKDYRELGLSMTNFLESEFTNTVMFYVADKKSDPSRNSVVREVISVPYNRKTFTNTMEVIHMIAQNR